MSRHLDTGLGKEVYLCIVQITHGAFLVTLAQGLETSTLSAPESGALTLEIVEAPPG